MEAISSRAAALYDVGKGIAVMDAPVFHGRQMVRIIAIQGEDVSGWIGEVDAAAMDLAWRLGAVGIIAVGRPGWKKETTRHGYRMTHATFFKEVNYA